MRPNEMTQVKHIPQRLIESLRRMLLLLFMSSPILLLTKILVLEKNQSVLSTLNCMFKKKNFSSFHINSLPKTRVVSLTFETSSKMAQSIAMESTPSLRDNMIKPLRKDQII